MNAIRLLVGISALLLMAPQPVVAVAVVVEDATLGGGGVGYRLDSGLVFERGESSIEVQVGAWLRGEILDESTRATRTRFTVPLLRPVLQVRLWEGEVLLFVQPELGGSNQRLLDAFVEWAPTSAFKLRLGQFRTPYSRAFITPIFRLQLPERGLVVDRFRLGRDTGVMAHGQLRGARYEYDLGVFSGADVNSIGKGGDDPLVVGRVALNFGQPVPYDQVPSLQIDSPSGISVGFGAAWREQKIESGNRPSASKQSWNGQLDVSAMHGPLMASLEAFSRETRLAGSAWKASYGATLQVGVFVLPKRVEIGGRGGWVSDGRDDLSGEAFVTVFWWLPNEYMGHHLKTTLAYRHDAYGRGAKVRDFDQALLQTQILF